MSPYLHNVPTVTDLASYPILEHHASASGFEPQRLQDGATHCAARRRDQWRQQSTAPVCWAFVYTRYHIHSPGWCHD